MVPSTDTRSHRSSYEIAVKVLSFFSCPDGKPKMYYNTKPFSLHVKRDDYSLEKFVDGIGEKVEWGSKQYVSLWRSLEDVSIEIRSDDDLLGWFDMHNDTGVVHIDAQINDFVGPIEQFTPTKRRCHPNVRNSNADSPCTPSLCLDLPVLAIEPTQPTQPPQPAPASQPTIKRANTKLAVCPAKQATKGRKSSREDEEPVGVDDEGMYSDVESLEVASDSSYDSDAAASSDSDSGCDSNYDGDEVITVDDDDDSEPVFCYDVDEPCVDEGVIYPDVNSVKSAVTHHAITDYAFKTVKKDE